MSCDSRSSSAFAHSFADQVLLPGMYVTAFENLSVTLMMQSYCSGATDFGSARMKSIVSVWNDLDGEYMGYSEPYGMCRGVWLS